MKCNETRFNLDMYIFGDLQSLERTAVEEHLSTCRSCRLQFAEMKELIYRLRRCGEPHVKMPFHLERSLNARFKGSGRTRRKSGLWRYAAAAVIALVILATALYSETIAQFVEDIPFIRKYFSFGDLGIEHSLSRGAGQLIEESKSASGITVTVHRLIADRNQTVILYSIASPAEADSALFDAAITDNRGRPALISGTYSYHEDLGKVTGLLRAAGLDEIGDKLRVQFNGIRFVKNHTRDLSFSAAGAISLSVPLVDGEGRSFGDFILESAEVQGEYLHLTARWEMDSRPPGGDPDGEAGGPGPERSAGPHITGVYRGGAPLELEERSENTGYARYRYRLDQGGSGAFQLTLAYTQTAAWAAEPLVFNIEVDRELAANSTFEQGIDKRVELEEGVSIYFHRILSTASRSALEFWVEGELDPGSNVRIWEPPPVLSLYSGGKKIEYDLRCEEIGSGFPGNQRSYFIYFDPTVPLASLRISIDGYLMWLDAPLIISLGATDTGKTRIAGGRPVTVEQIDLDATLADYELRKERSDGRIVLVTFLSPAILFYNAEITDSAGTRDALDVNVCRLENGQWRTAVWFKSDDTAWSLAVEPYVLFTAYEMDIFP